MSGFPLRPRLSFGPKGKGLMMQRSDDTSVFDALPDAAFVVERESGLILAANPAAARLHGYEREELLGRSLAELSPEPLETTNSRLHKRKDGTTFLAEASASAVAWQGRNATAVVVRDITARKAMEDALRDSKALLSNAFNRNPLLMSVADLSTDRYLEVNDAFCARVGFARDEMIGHTAVELGLITQQERDSLAQRLMAAPKKSAIEMIIRTRDGTPLTCRYWGEVVQSAEGLKIFAAAEDATEQKKLEARLAQGDRLASMGMLAAGLAHEINNPLAYVLGNLEVLSVTLPRLVGLVRQLDEAQAEKTLGQGVLDSLLESVRDALEGTLRIRKISRSLDTFARAEQVSLMSVELNRAIEAAAAMAHNEVKHRAVLVKELGPVPAVLGSDGKLAQVFLNILINAAHAIPEGHFERNQIRVRTWAEGAHVFAEISDTGPGMPPEVLSRVFEPFFTTKKVGEGSGLGLAISKNIITEFGGELRVESELGKGTRVTVRLPVSTVATPAEPPPAPSQGVAEAALRGHILLVDDEEPIRRLIKRLLEPHEVITAASGREAKNLLEKDSGFDVIFCDLMMPDMTGMDLHAWLVKENPALAQKVVFISGGAFTPHAADYLASVSNLKLDKPIPPERLKAVAAEMVLQRSTSSPCP